MKASEELRGFANSLEYNPIWDFRRAQLMRLAKDVEQMENTLATFVETAAKHDPTAVLRAALAGMELERRHQASLEEWCKQNGLGTLEQAVKSLQATNQNC